MPIEMKKRWALISVKKGKMTFLADYYTEEGAVMEVTRHRPDKGELMLVMPVLSADAQDWDEYDADTEI
jgi:hypothetical protein